MRKKILIKAIMIVDLLLLFPVVVSAANLDLPYYRGFEADPVDVDMDDDSCNGLDVGTMDDYCTVKVRDDYPARYGKQYLEMRCEYNDVSTRGKAMRAGNISFEGFRSGTSCHEMRTNDNTEYWFGWSNYIPRDYLAEKFRHAFFQIGTDDPHSVTSSMQYGAEPDPSWFIWNISDSGKDKVKIGDWRDEKGNWIDWVVHVVWFDDHHRNARFEIFKDGVLVFSRNGLENVVEGGEPILVFCDYNWAYSSKLDAKAYIENWNEPHHRAVYMDEFRFYEQIGGSGANDYCDVSPPIVPAQPVITYPSNNDTGIPTAFTLNYGGYTDKRSDPQNCFSYSTTHIQVDEYGGDWSSLVYESTSASETSKEIAGLAASTQYQIRVRHKSDRQGSGDTYFGSWSSIVKFSTGATGTTSTYSGLSTPLDFKVLLPK